MKTQFPFSKLMAALNLIRSCQTNDLEVRGISRDSRTIGKDGVFVAIAGHEADSNDFVAHARKNGAAVVVSERPPDNLGPWVQVPDARVALAQLARAYHNNPDRAINLTAITGTNGKTTTAYLVRSILAAAGRSCGLMSTIEYVIGDQTTPAVRTTPEATDVCEALAKMVAKKQTHAVMEVTSHGLALHRTHGLEFDTAIFTNFSHEHLDFHNTPAAYLAAKMRLFKSLRPESTAILNADDEAGLGARNKTRARILTFGVRNPHAEISGEMLTSNASRQMVKLKFPNQECIVESLLLGDFNLHNILAAATLAWSLGVTARDIQEGVKALRAVPGRLEQVGTGHPFQIFVDFAHTPAALLQALTICRQLCHNRLHLVFGCGGERDHAKRPLMGKIAEDFADSTIVTSDNPRREDPYAIVRQIMAGAVNRAHFCSIPDRESAIRLALNSARAGDLVLIAGRGHETHQEIGAVNMPFDDRDVARKILQQEADDAGKFAA